jgi:hypothetical protein
MGVVLLRYKARRRWCCYEENKIGLVSWKNGGDYRKKKKPLTQQANLKGVRETSEKKNATSSQRTPTLRYPII